MPCVKVLNDAVIFPQLCDLWEGNFPVYGVRNLWKAARRAGIGIGRDQTERLMDAGKEGCSAVEAGENNQTRTDPTSVKNPDLVERQFCASAPNQFWVTDLTFAATSAGVAYLCLIIDVFFQNARQPEGSQSNASRNYVGRDRDGQMVLGAKITRFAVQ